jgi:hypothetical protein
MQTVEEVCSAVQEGPPRPWSQMSVAQPSPAGPRAPAEEAGRTPTLTPPGTAATDLSRELPGAVEAAGRPGRPASPASHVGQVGQVGQALHQAASGVVMVGLIHSPLGAKRVVDVGWEVGGDSCQNSVGSGRGVLGSSQINRSHPGAAQPQKGSTALSK